MGMPKFGGRLNKNDVEDIRKFILTKAKGQKQPAKDETRYQKEEEQTSIH